MGILDALVKALVSQQTREEKKRKGKRTGVIKEEEVTLAREVAVRIAELERREGA